MDAPHPPASALSRRHLLRLLAAAGAGGAVFGRALAAVTGDGPVTSEAIARAAWIAGLEFTDKEREQMLEDVTALRKGLAELRAVPLDNAVPPALRFDPTPGDPPTEVRESVATVPPDRAVPRDDLAWRTAVELGQLVRTRQVSSVELTRGAIERLKKHDPQLLAVVTLLEERALKQAEQADREIAAGGPRGPLHGVPWGAKDLLAVPGAPTTWGSVPYRHQVRPETAAVVEKLDAAGAVLAAKTSVGELAWGDVWFGGTTKNPWNPEQGSSGSSAGSASAVAAGLLPFALGTETWGSIVSPCTRCGATGLRPTFGRVSRHGAMALAWSMDKIGPIARSVEDLAVVFAAVQGADPRDPAVEARPFRWPARKDPRTMKVGVVEALFDEDYTTWADPDEDKGYYAEWKAFDRRTLDEVRKLGVTLVPLKLPATYPVPPLSLILTAEAATLFDELVRTNRDDLLVRQVPNAWPNTFRQGQLITAVDYLRANRIRTLAMQELDVALRGLDVWIAPSFGGNVLLLTNLTGHPCVTMPNGFTAKGLPTSITFLGQLHGEENLLALAELWQRETGYHRKRPPLFA